MTSLNFDHLQEISPELHRPGTLAERFFAKDADTSLIKSHQFGEYMVKEIAALSGVYDPAARETTSDLPRRPAIQQVLPREVADIFHALRKSGNDTTRYPDDSAEEAFMPILITPEIEWAVRGRLRCQSPTPDGRHFHQHLSEVRRVFQDSRIPVDRSVSPWGRILNCR